MKAWETIDALFAALNGSDVPYIILRNYEEIDDENFYMEGHADIDFLTSDAGRLSALMEGKPRYAGDDGIHYAVSIAGTEVAVDIRTVGDGYYDKAWERTLLDKRLLKDRRFWVSDPENYYYSLVYHAVLQKKALGSDYLVRLNTMAASLGVSADSEESHLGALEAFMKAHGYRYTYPLDVWVPLRVELVDPSMVRKPMNVRLRDLKTSILSAGSRIKRKLLHK